MNFGIEVIESIAASNLNAVREEIYEFEGGFLLYSRVPITLSGRDS